MNKFFKFFLLTAACLSANDMAAADGIEPTHLSNNNTMVRVKGNEAMVLIPIQDSMPDSKIEVLVNGELKRTFYARLACDKVDFYVPFNLEPYASQGEVIFNVYVDGNGTQGREVANLVCWDEMKLANSFSVSNTEKFRPQFHHTPEYGWMNDPNGMVYKDGVWHLYYQWNPYGSKWQNLLWGHSTSTDLVNWTPQGIAIEPDGLGLIFSGSGVVDKNNTAGFGNDKVIAIYTSAGANQLQSLAYSNDNGKTFTKYPGNPIITTPREARDPNMFWNEDINKWNLILSSALDHEMLIYSSDNLIDWTLESSFGKGYGCQEGVWECPDLMKLPVEGTKTEKWVLICNINPGGPFGGSGTQYFVGDFDGKTFKCDTPANVTKWMDYGKDHYATVSWSNSPDNRHTVIGWMSNWDYANDVPTKQFRSANTLPRDLSLYRALDGELYLTSAPSPELAALRGEKKAYSNKSLSASPVKMPIPELCEIDMDVEMAKQGNVVLTLANDKGETVEMQLDNAASTFSMDRTRSGITNFSDKFPIKTTAPIHVSKKNKTNHSLRIFIDKCSIEVFGDGGKFAMTNLVFPENPYTTLSVSTANGKSKIKTLNVYSIKK